MRKGPKRPKNGLSGAKRTPGTIITRLSKKRVSKSKGVSPYVICRAYPFAAPGGDGHPDGGNSNYVVSDTFAVSNFTCTTAGQTVVIQTLPALPAMAMVKSSSNLLADGVTLTGSPIVLDGTVQGAWCPICVPNIFTSAVTPGVAYVDPWSSTGLRFVTFGYRIVYTGPAVSCAGSITVTPNSASVETYGTTSAAGLTVNVVSAANTSLGACLANTPVMAMDCGVNVNAMTRASRTHRPEQGFTLVPQHRSKNYKIQQTPTTPYTVIANKVVTGPATTAYSNLMYVVDPARHGVITFDNDWTGFQIVFNNLNADASYRIEAVVCMEFNPAVGTPFYNTAKDKSHDDPPILQQGEKAAAQNEIAPA